MPPPTTHATLTRYEQYAQENHGHFTNRADVVSKLTIWLDKLCETHNAGGADDIDIKFAHRLMQLGCICTRAYTDLRAEAPGPDAE